MSAARTVKNLLPAAFGQDLTSLDLRTFLVRHGDAPLLLVRIMPGDTEVELGLAATVSSRPGRAATPKPLPFHTGYQEEPRTSQFPRPNATEPRVMLRQLLEREAYFAVPLHKREDSDAMSMDRISVGRANNKDVVLRHPSISKFHAWFEVDEAQTVYVADAGSTNGTQVDGRPLKPKMSIILSPGQSIQFGAIECVLTPPDLLWAALNG